MKTVFEMLFGAIQPFAEQELAETDEDFIRRFVVAIAKIDKDTWDSLQKESTDWYNNTARCINNKRPVENWPKCPGFVSIHEQEAGVIGEPTTQQFQPAPAKSKRVAPKYSKYAGAVKEARKILMMHPEWSARTIHKYLDATGFSGIKFDLISIICSECRTMILLARELGFWRDISIYDKTIPPDPTEVEQANAESGS
jgi:hypothetical protein